MKTIYKILISAAVAATCWSCSKDYLDTYPTSSTSAATIFETTENAKLAVNGIARIMTSQHLSTQGFCGEGTIKYMFGEFPGENYSIPNLTGWSTVLNNEYITRNTSSYTYYPWFYYYMMIGNANEILRNIDAAEGPQAEKDFITAQALTFRAYAYTMLVQLYCYRWADSENGTAVSKLNNGLVLRTEENMDNTDVPLSSSGAVYELIYSDLQRAVDLFTSCGIDRNPDDLWLPNIDVANATWARAALSKQDYATALEKATLAKADYPLMSNDEYQSGFNAPNQEWIFGSFGGSEENLYYYSYFAYVGYDAGSSRVRGNPSCISRELFEEIPATDIRKGMYLDPISEDNYSSSNGELTDDDLIAEYKAKYPTITSAHKLAAYNQLKVGVAGTPGIGYLNHFRSAEMYLIIAESNYFLSNEAAAREAMNELTRDSGRDPQYNCDASGEALLDEIKLYWDIELFLEGFDWFNKKRWNEPLVRHSFDEGGNFNSLMSNDRDVEFGNRWTYVTPLIEIQYNRALQ